MAQKIVTEYIDDIDGSEAEREFTFSVDGTDYAIDLSTDNIVEFTHAVAGFVESARRLPKARVRPSGTLTVRANREHLSAVREWARHNGYQVSDRGRVPMEILAKFDAAHAG